jgi:hypothetical protein
MANQSNSYIDDLFTRVVDSDDQWGPLLFLRPALHQRFGLARMSALAVLVGGAFGLAGSILLGLMARAAARPPVPIYVFPLVLTAVYFSVCQLSIVPAWNRRALRLAKRGVAAAPSTRP